MPSFVHAIDACDMDMDGSIDIVVSCAYEDSLVILYNDGVGNFQINAYHRITGFSICGCIDGDSIPDIITTKDGDLIFIKNNGDRTLEQGMVVETLGTTFPFECVVDMNNDGWNDLLYDINNEWGIYENNGDLTFTQIILGVDNDSKVNPSIGYFDEDSQKDIVVSYSYQNSILLLVIYFDSCMKPLYPFVNLHQNIQ
jgi:hypothetical protein